MTIEENAILYVASPGCQSPFYLTFHRQEQPFSVMSHVFAVAYQSIIHNCTLYHCFMFLICQEIANAHDDP